MWKAAWIFVLAAVFVTGLEATAQANATTDNAAVVQGYSWCHDSTHGTYACACRRAAYLRNCGYCTCICRSGHCYDVYKKWPC
jgi:hypothetical protein